MIDYEMKFEGLTPNDELVYRDTSTPSNRLLVFSEEELEDVRKKCGTKRFEELYEPVT